MKSLFSSQNQQSISWLLSGCLATLTFFIPCGLIAEEVLFSDDFESGSGGLGQRPGWSAKGLPTDAFRVEGGELIASTQADGLDHGIALLGLGLGGLYEVQFDLRVGVAPHREGDFVLVLSNEKAGGPWIARVEVSMDTGGYRFALAAGEGGERAIGQALFLLGDVVRIHVRIDRATQTVTLKAGSPGTDPVEMLTLLEPQLMNTKLNTPFFLRRKTINGTGNHAIDNLKVVIPNE